MREHGDVPDATDEQVLLINVISKAGLLDPAKYDCGTPYKRHSQSEFKCLVAELKRWQKNAGLEGMQICWECEDAIVREEGRDSRFQRGLCPSCAHSMGIEALGRA